MCHLWSELPATAAPDFLNKTCKKSGTVQSDSYKNYHKQSFLKSSGHVHEGHTDSNFSSSVSSSHLLNLGTIYLRSKTTKTGFTYSAVIHYKPDRTVSTFGKMSLLLLKCDLLPKCPSGYKASTVHVSWRLLISYKQHHPMGQHRMLTAERHIFMLNQPHHELILRGTACEQRCLFFH